MSWAPATGPPTVAAAVLMDPDRVAVALNGSPVTLSWTARQALMRRLQHVQETVRLRASFTVADAWPPVTLLPGQRTALLRVLEGWALDRDGYEPIPPELLEFRDALIADSARQRSPAAPSRTLPPMPERLDFITVKLSTQEVTLGWETRRALLANLALGQQDVGRAIRRAFDDVDASRPVTLDLGQKTYLLELLEQWSLDTVGGYDAMSAELFTLRNALIDDLRDAEPPGGDT